MVLLVLSLLALAAGPLLYRLADRAPASLAGLDGFVMVSVGGLGLVHIIPHAAAAIGPLAIGVALLGFVGPGLVEHQLERAAQRAHAATLALAVGGLVLHEFFDGVALTAPPEEGHAASLLAIAVVLHRLPIAITIWWLLVPGSGRRVAALVLAALGASTAAGYFLGDAVGALVDERWVALLEALVAGSLLHVVVHRPAPIAAPSDGGRGRGRDRLLAGVGALLGVAMVAWLADEPLASHAHDAVGFADGFLTLAYESAPALLVAHGLSALGQVVLPRASLGWLRRGRSPLGQAARGVAYGLPLPICSCGVVPAYRTLFAAGVPATAAMAFLVATPGLGLDALLISLPLLGAELALLRIAAAAAIAILIGVTVGRAARSRATPSPVAGDAPAAALAAAARLRGGLRFALVEVVDHTAPWLLLGLALAALAGPLLEGRWIAALPWGIDVVLLALLGIPSYVSASAATPLIAVLVFKGVSPGAALAFLLTGPAINSTALAALAELHGRRVAVGFAAVLASATIGLGLVVDVGLGGLGGLSLAAAVAEGPSLIEVGCLGGLTLAVALSVLRQGPRGFVGQVLRPYADADDGHGHGHERGHAH